MLGKNLKADQGFGYHATTALSAYVLQVGCSYSTSGVDLKLQMSLPENHQPPFDLAAEHLETDSHLCSKHSLKSKRDKYIATVCGKILGTERSMVYKTQVATL